MAAGTPLSGVKYCLIFDLDGTLVDSLPGISGSLNRALASCGLPGHPPAAVRNFIGDGARILVQRAAPNADLRLLAEIEAAFKTDYQRTWPDGTAPFAGVADALAALHARNVPLAVLSNKPHEFTATIVARLFPTIRFAAVLGQRDGIPHKPDPAGALEIATRLGIPPAACTLVGDSTMDLETARNAGMDAIAVAWGYHDRPRLEAAGATQFLDRPHEFSTLGAALAAR